MSGEEISSRGASLCLAQVVVSIEMFYEI